MSGDLGGAVVSPRHTPAPGPEGAARLGGPPTGSDRPLQCNGTGNVSALWSNVSSEGGDRWENGRPVGFSNAAWRADAVNQCHVLNHT